MAAEQFGDLGQVGGHRVGHVRHLPVDRLRHGGFRAVVIVAVGATQAVGVVDAKPVEQRVVDTVKLDLPVAQQQGDVFAHLHDRAEVGAAQPAAEKPEFEASETAVDLRMEPHDADMGVGQGGAVVEPFGVVVLHVERHRPRDLAVERAVERGHTGSAHAVAEEHRVGENVIGRSDHLEAVVLGEKVDRHEVLRLVFSPCDQPRQVVGQRWAVAEDDHPARGIARGPRTADIVAEILLDGHHGEIQRRIERITDECDELLGCGHGGVLFANVINRSNYSITKNRLFKFPINII